MMDNISQWLFAAPWWVLAIAFAAALALLFVSLSRTEKRLRQAAVLVLLLVLIWAVVGLVVETPVEEVRGRTVEMIEAYEQTDWERLSQLVDEETRFSTMLRGQEIVDAAKLTHDALQHGEITVSSVETQRDGLGILVIVRVTSEQQNQWVPRLTTLWKFDYRKYGGEWQLERVEPMATEHLDPVNILRNVRIPESAAQRQR